MEIKEVSVQVKGSPESVYEFLLLLAGGTKDDIIKQSSEVKQEEAVVVEEEKPKKRGRKPKEHKAPEEEPIVDAEYEEVSDVTSVWEGGTVNPADVPQLEEKNPFDDVPSDTNTVEEALSEVHEDPLPINPDLFGSEDTHEEEAPKKEVTFGEMKESAKQWGTRHGKEYKSLRDAVSYVYRNVGGSEDGGSRGVKPENYAAVLNFFVSDKPVPME